MRHPVLFTLVFIEHKHTCCMLASYLLVGVALGSGRLEHET